MAWTTPGTAVAGEVLTAAWLNTNVRDNAIMGRAVYTNEAARDAAITSPEEGMICYLTAPTIPAATGEDTAVPSGITTIYNGSVWVCTTPVSAFTVNVGTTTSTSYTTTLSGTPGANPSVTLVTGTTARVSTFVRANTSTQGRAIFVAVSVSGASTIAAADENGASFGQDVADQRRMIGVDFVFTGLTAGTNTFTMEYKINAAGTINYIQRRIMAVGIA